MRPRRSAATRRASREPDPQLRDTERVPLPDPGAGEEDVDEDGIPTSVREFFEREVRPHAPDAWIDTTKRDKRDGHVGLVGYEINFNRYFYRFKPPPPPRGDRSGHRSDRSRDRRDAARRGADPRHATLTRRRRAGPCGEGRRPLDQKNAAGASPEEPNEPPWQPSQPQAPISQLALLPSSGTIRSEVLRPPIRPQQNR